MNGIGASAYGISSVEIAESSGSPSICGGNGANVRAANVAGSGKSGPCVHAQVGKDERIYLLAPIPGAGPEFPYSFGSE